jgi:hypothetical protein
MRIFLDHLGITDHGVQRRAQLMTDARKEFRFCLTGVERRARAGDGADLVRNQKARDKNGQRADAQQANDHRPIQRLYAPVCRRRSAQAAAPTVFR